VTVEQAEQELASIQERASQLQQFIDLSRQLDGSAKHVSASSKHSRNASAPAAPFSGRTADTAWDVLEAHGKLHLNQLVAEMHKMGWAGLGSDGKDRNAVYAAMHRLPDNFKAWGKGIWGIKKSKGKRDDSQDVVNR
jgi:hypothetical protein